MSLRIGKLCKFAAMKKETAHTKETDFQALTDLVAVHALAQIAWQNSQEVDASGVAGHQSDSSSFGEVGGHQSDTPFPVVDKVETNPVTFAWRLMKMLRRFFEGR
ncbi:MAG: hypothetical protein AAFP82_17335 [Bacteroidota bacterium]